MPLTDNLLSFWRLDESGTGTRADSKGTNTLTNNNAVTNTTGLQRITPGSNIASSFVAASTQWLSVADNAGFALGTNFSYSGWYNMPDNSVLGNQSIFGKWDYQTQGDYWAGMVNSTNDVRIFILSAVNEAGSDFVTWAGAGVIGSMTHYVFTYDGTQSTASNRCKLYVNGALQTGLMNGTIPATLQHGTADFKIGKFGGTLTRYLNGPAQDCGLWTRTLSSSDVTTLYNNGSPPYFDGSSFITQAAGGFFSQFF